MWPWTQSARDDELESCAQGAMETSDDAAAQPAASGCDDAASATLRNDWLATAMAAAAELTATTDACKAELLLEEARIARENVSMLQRYTHMCSLLTRYELRLGQRDAVPLVAMWLPVHLLPSTRTKLLEGLKDSLVAFVHELHHASVTTNACELEPERERCAVGAAGFSNAIAADLWVQTTKVFDREITEGSARARLQYLLHDFAARAVAEEQTRLGQVRAHCVHLRDACADFARRALRVKRSQDATARQTAARRWLVGAARGETRAAVVALARRRRQAALFAKLDLGIVVAAFAKPEQLDGSKADALYECMSRVHEELAAAMNWEVRRADWLQSAPKDHPCWCGLAIAHDSCDHRADERLLQAPSHMACFATGKLRVVADRRLQTTPYGCGLPVVRVARLLAQLLKEGHVPLNRLCSTFARRTAACEFAKYEQAARRVECESLIPFGRAVRVPYVAGALSSAIRDILSEAPPQ